MTAVAQAIILAAGRGSQADGIPKALIRHPVTGKSILQHAIEAFTGKRVIAVVGYRAISIMERHPDIDYVINHEWSISHNSMSAALALNETPTYVVSGDIFFEQSLVEFLDHEAPNLALTELRENRSPTALNCILRADGSIDSVYRGALKGINHPEAIGLFKISDSRLLRQWKRQAMAHGHLFAGQTLPYDGAPVIAVPRGNHQFDEINTTSDYLRLLERARAK
jgi:choline kinase